MVTVVTLWCDVLGYDRELHRRAHPSWCWIDPARPDALLWQYATGKLWEIVAYITTIVLYALVKRKLCQQVSDVFENEQYLSKNFLCVTCLAI